MLTQVPPMLSQVNWDDPILAPSPVVRAGIEVSSHLEGSFAALLQHGPKIRTLIAQTPHANPRQTGALR